MTPDSLRDAFEAWAPPHVEWAAWCKPTLFIQPPATPRATPAPASMPPVPASPDSTGLSAPGGDVDFAREIPKHSALVLDLPGPRSVEVGVSLLDRGYWPVPLFNATPGPNPLVDVAPIVRALLHAAPVLRSAAPRAGDQTLPCFLLDSGRCPQGLRSTPGRYDNRSVVFPQDFPSATRLRSRGIEQVLVVHQQQGTTPFAADLAHVLYAWQRDGLRIARLAPSAAARPEPASIPRPKGFGLALRRVLTFAGLRRSAAGGFGAFTPEASTGSGYS